MQPSLIQDRIYEIRGQKVMLDFDLAELYRVETRILNQSVKRNYERFPQDFMFQLSAAEWKLMSSQFVMTSNKKRPRKAIPYAFTEHGVSMLASVLRSSHAINMNIAIIRAFVALRQVLTHENNLADKWVRFRHEVLERLSEHDTQLSAVYDAIENLLDEKVAQNSWEDRERIGY